MSNIQIFNNPEFGQIRTIEKDGEAWFVASDVCAVFGETNRNRAMQALDEDEKGYTQMTTPGGSQKVSIVNEGGLYALLFAMQPTKARGVSAGHIERRQAQLKKFKRWVTSEVLPSIRKHGMYAVDELLDNPDIAIQVFTALKEERSKNKQLTLHNAQLEQQVSEYEPKAQYVDKILESTGTVTTTQIAADYGLSARKLNKILHEERIQYNVGGQWILYREHMGLGYTKSETIPIQRSDGAQDVKMQTKWTQKGRLMIHNLLERRGIQASMDKVQEARAS